MVLTRPSTPGISWQAKQLPNVCERMISKPILLFGFSSAIAVLLAKIIRAQGKSFVIKRFWHVGFAMTCLKLGLTRILRARLETWKHA
jgi:hypothetical protein